MPSATRTWCGSTIACQVLQRAMPWTRLILKTRRVKGDLNLSWGHRLSVLLVWAGLLGLCASPFDLRALVLLPACWALALAINRRLLHYKFQQKRSELKGGKLILVNIQYLLL